MRVRENPSDEFTHSSTFRVVRIASPVQSSCDRPMSTSNCGAMGSTKICDRPAKEPGMSCGSYGHDAVLVQKGRDVIELMASSGLSYAAARRKVIKDNAPLDIKPKKTKKESVVVASAAPVVIESTPSISSLFEDSSVDSRELPGLQPPPRSSFMDSSFLEVPKSKIRPDLSKTVSMFDSLRGKCRTIDSMNLDTSIRVKDLAVIPAAAAFTASYRDSTSVPNASIQKLASDLNQLRSSLNDIASNPNVATEVNVAGFATEQLRLNTWLTSAVEDLSYQVAAISFKLPANADSHHASEFHDSNDSMDLN